MSLDAKDNVRIVREDISMLDGLRNFARTWPGKILGVLMLIGLAGFGMSGVFTNIGFNKIADVGGEEITTRQFQRSYSNQINEFASRTGTVPTSQEALAYGIPSAVINQLAQEAAVDGLGKKFGLGVSDIRMGDMVRQDPSFGGTLGGFNAENFRSVLQRSGWTENEYFSMQTKAAIRQQIALGLFRGVNSPQAALDLITRFGKDKRTVEYFLVNADNMLPPEDPTDAEVLAYLTENQTAYRTPPTRKIKVMALSPQAIADAINISDSEISAEYERTKASYVRIESRTLHQAVLSSDFYVQRFEAGKAAGETFEEIIADTGLDIVDLGTVAEAQITDILLAQTAFSLDEGEFEIIAGIGDKRAIFVSKIEAGGQVPLADVRDRIEEKLKLKSARELYVDYLDQIEELRAAFRPIAEIASQYDLELVDAAISADGNGLDAVSSIPEDGRRKVATAVFAAKDGGLAPTVALGANLNIWFDLVTIEPSRDQTIAEVGDEIRETLLAGKVLDALSERVDSLVGSIGDGQSFEDVALGGQYALAQVNDLTRTGAAGSQFGAGVVAAMFGGDEGHFGSARNDDGNYVVFQVLEVTPSTEITDVEREFIDNSIIDSIYAEFVNGLVEDAGLRINQQTLTTLLAPQGGFQ